LSLVDIQAVATVAIGLAVAMWERQQRNTSPPDPVARRWTTNIALYAMNSALIAVPSTYLFNRALETNPSTPCDHLCLHGIPYYLLISWWLLILDLASYFLHRLLHALPLLYRMHCAHHSDCEVDATTALRRHPVEFIWNATIVCAIGLLLGVPITVIGAYGALATVLQIWHHGNFVLPVSAERILSLAIVTPSMHRLHHSIAMSDANSNYGTVLSIWDRIFRTRLRAPAPEIFGVKGLEGPEHQRLEMALLSPLIVDLHCDND